jgi:hypothetical protein
MSDPEHRSWLRGGRFEFILDDLDTSLGPTQYFEATFGGPDNARIKTRDDDPQRRSGPRVVLHGMVPSTHPVGFYRLLELNRMTSGPHWNPTDSEPWDFPPNAGFYVVEPPKPQGSRRPKVMRAW